jgi:hypothetical protein
MENRSMSDLPPVPQPPETKPFAPEKLSGGGGCQRPFLIGCGLLALLLGIAAIVFVVKAKDVLAFAMNQLRESVVAQLPEESEEADRQRIEAGFDTAMVRIRSGQIDPAALQELQKALSSAAAVGTSRRLTRAEVDGLLAALDKFNGVKPAGEPPGSGSGPDPEEESSGEPSSGAAEGWADTSCDASTAPAAAPSEAQRPPAP